MIVDRESADDVKHCVGRLPLCQSDSESVLEHVIFDSGRFRRISGQWLLMEMVEDRDVDRFMEIGKELQAEIDAGKFDEAEDKDTLEGWRKTTLKFHEAAFK